MVKHEKMLFHPVSVERPDPQYAALLQEQLGGANGELKAAMQYMSQSFRIKDPEIKDLFLDIAAEELGHMEMIAQTINLLNGHDVDAQTVPAGEIRSHVLQGLNPGLINASGYSWTGDYVTVTGDLCADLLSNIASEQRAKVVYEYLYRQIDDKKVKETIDFLLNREEAHNAMFREAFNKVQNSGSNQNFGTITAAKMYFSMSEPSPAGSQFPNAKVTPPSFERDQFRQQDPSVPPGPVGQRVPVGNSYSRNCAPDPCSHTPWDGGVCTNYHRIVDHTSYHRSHCICSIESLLILNLYLILCAFDII